MLHHFASEVVLLIGGDGCSDELRFGVVRIVKPFVHPYQEVPFSGNLWESEVRKPMELMET